MTKRILSAFLAVIMLLGMLPTAVFAASSEEEALGEVDIYNGGYKMSYLSINGRIREQEYTYYNHVSPNGKTKEVPAYCVNPNTKGVPQTVAEGESIAYLAKEKASDPKITGIVANGYPNRGLSELGLDNKYQAYYATKMALWCYILSNWDINNLKVNPNLTGEELVRAQKILAAAKDIYRRGTTWTENLSPNVTCTADRDVAYSVTINGKQYKQQIFTFWSKTWVCDYTVKVSFTDPARVPNGTRIVDMNNNDITKITTSGTGDGYAGQFKVLYPVDSIAGQSGNVQLSFLTDVYQYAIFYATCVEVDKYGNLQNYMCDTDPTRTMELSAYSSYGDEPEEELDTGLQIIKYEAGTTIPLSGAMFEVVGPDGATVGTFTTDSNGKIRIPLTLTGSYTVYERVAPEYYLLSEEPAQNVQVVYGEVAQVVFENEPYGNLRIEKTSNTGMNLPGAIVTATHIESGKTYTAETNSAGVAIFNKVKPGAYRIQETAAPSGWLLNDTIYTTTVVAGETTTFHLVNEELPGLRIIKYDRKNMVAMPDVTFEIYRDGVSIGRYKTDEFGEILLTDVPPGTYRAFEVDTGSEGHILDTTPQEIELSAGDGIRELLFFNDVKPGLRLIKVDSADPSKVIPNAVFEIKSVAGDYGPKEFTTDQNGEIDLSKLPTGAYVVTEKSCEGYVIDDAQRIIQLDPNEDAQFVFTNTIKPSLQVIKTSSDGTPLKGVTFRIAKIEDGTHYLDRTTNANGEILISDLEPGVYSVKETATDSSHILDVREYHMELFPGKTSTLVIENQKRPNLIVYKHDADTGETIANTVFEVRAADGHSIDEIKTDSEGRAELKNLLPGVYQITEKSVPSDYLLDAPSQLVTLYANRDHTVYFENHKKPSLTVKKIDSVTGDPLQGAKFQVTYASNATSSGEINDLGTYYTDENGQFQITNLKDGWYKVTELEAPTGYAIKEATQEVYIQSGTAKTLTFENIPLSALVVWKYDSVTGEAVSNAVFQIKYLSGTSGTGGTVIGTYKTSANGSFTVTGLKAGTYVVEELASDSGHVIDTAPQTAYISGKEQDVVQLYFGNAPKGALLVKKIDSVTREPLSDVEFFVTTSDGAVVGNANGKFVTDSAGSFTVEGITPGTTLIVKETRAKDGYLLDDTPQTAQIKAGQTVTLEFRNQPKGSLIINKLDSVTKEPLKGVEFKITYADGSYVDAENGQLSTKGIYTTDANGQIILSGVYGTLIVTEEKTIDGYTIDPETRSQTVVVNANDTQTLTFYNIPNGCLMITKVDSITKEPLSGVEFKIVGCNGCEYPAGTYTTDSDGVIWLKNIPNGCYSVVETRAKDGYLLDNTVHTVKVEAGTCKKVTFENTPLGGLVIKKLDAVTREPLANAVFRVTTADGTAVGNTGGEYRTDENGYISIPDIKPCSLIVTEVQAPDGYLLDNTPKTVEIKDHQTYVLEFFNQPLGNLVIHKLDSVTKKPLEGVQFKITYADGSYVDAEGGQLSSNGLYFTDKDGKITINGVVGTLVVTEVTTLPGYTIDEATRSQTVVVNTNDTQSLYFYNDPVGGLLIIKSDEDTGKRIPGVQFEVRKMNGEIIGSYTTDRNGTIQLPELESGWYTVTELKAASGYLLDSTPQQIEVKDGQTATLELTNHKSSKILLHKTDAQTGKGIYGAVFLLYDSNKNPIGEYTTDQDGYIYMDEDLEDGRYYLREIRAADGYVLDTELKTIYVRYGSTTEIEWTNTAECGQIQIIKKSADDNAINGLPAGTLLEGAVFEIYDKAGNTVDTIKTDKNGRAVSKTLPLSRYTIREVTAPSYYAVNPTVMTAYLEYSGQIVTFEVEDESVSTGVSIKKTGPVQAVSGQPVRYVFSNIQNTSSVSLNSFYWRDTLPAQVTLNKIVTGSYNQQLNYKVVYKTNLSTDYRTLADNLSTSKVYVLDASPAVLGLAANERVTEVMFVFGTVKAGFAQVETPYFYTTARSGLANGTSIVNVADVGGLYNGAWVQAVSRWLTTVYAQTVTTLPKTGY